VRPYPELPGLEALYLEDSYVLGVRESPSEVRFELEAVLTEDHPSWSPPRPNEQYAYRRVDLVFPNPGQIEWVEKAMTPFQDATGEIDYGNIDSFEWQTDLYDLHGDWGHIRIESDTPVVVDRETRQRS
jgi:hypothetical protein